MKIKVCGMREERNIGDVSRLGIDFMGFIFYPRSPRYCEEYISADILRGLPEGVEPVAVTVNMDYNGLLHLSSEYGFRTFQLHGSESPALCRRLRESGFRVIKAFGIKERENLQRIREYSGNVDFFLFDTATASHGGSGRKFDWGVLEEYSFPELFLLSGGISPVDAEIVYGVHHPRFLGIDLNSGFEITPGLKDPAKIEEFITRLSASGSCE